MLKVLLILTLSVILFSCNTEELERLESQNNDLNQKVTALQDQLQESIGTKKSMDLLSRSLRALRADIITTKGTITVKFFPRKAPLHVMNFILLSEGGFYNGVKFHRVIKNFMIQTGDPNSKDNNPSNDGQGGSSINIPAEFNDINHARGVLSMARSQDPNSASSQFFIMHADNAGLNNKYSVFGEVTKGMDVVDKIATTKTVNKGIIRDRPAKDITIKNIRVYGPR